MTDLRNAVLATLAYYDIFDFPLTLSEIHRYLINPARFEKNGTGIGDIFVGDIMQTLDQLIADGKIGMKYGYYMVHPDRIGIYERRIDREKISAQKWKKLLRLAKWFQAVPYLRVVFVSGSMAMQNATPESDFDVLVVIRQGRLYTGRIFLSLVASLFRARRKRFDLTAPDKFCFNHYITDHQLKIPHQSLYNAQMYINLQPILDLGDIFPRLYHENAWLNKFVYNFKPEPSSIKRSVHFFPFLNFIARVGEFILNSWLGDGVEMIFRRYQQNRIKGNTATYAPGGRTLFDDSQLEFHPHSAERAILERYNATVKEFGTFWNYSELDSGLR
jgi:predicted nucleotidyltransferase